MSERYNPQSIEKKAKSLGFFDACFADLTADVNFRFGQLNGENKIIAPADCFNTSLKADKAAVLEYGIDASRLAQITAQKQSTGDELLESAHKWLSSLHNFLLYPNKAPFNSAVWLECMLLSEQSAITKGYTYGGLAFVKKAKKNSQPSSTLSKEQYSLILSSVYPFCPIFALYHSNRLSAPIMSIKALKEAFNRYVCVKFSLKNDVWFYKVFERTKFASNPLSAFLSIKWVKAAAQGKNLTLSKEPKGFLLCFS